MTELAWQDGYVADTGYADRFFHELSPVWLNYVAALNGLPPRDLQHAFAYLELGCGFGTSVVVNAAAFPRGRFHACDFNPTHIEGGRRYAATLGVENIEWHQRSFQELRSRDLPAFDFIVVHGVYSWVGDAARQAIRQIVTQMLKPGGVLYLSYNCLPGWSVEAPLRKLLLELALSASGDSRHRAEHARAALAQLAEVPLRYFKANPAALSAVDSYLKGPSDYLVHEFLNQAWEPFYSTDVGDQMHDTGVTFAGSATLVDNHQELLVGDAVAQAVARLPTARQRQLTMDFAVNRRFRRDVFTRSDEPEAPAAAAHPIESVIVGCPSSAARIDTRVTVPRGAITFREDFVNDLRAIMATGSVPFGDIVRTLSHTREHARDVARNLTFLIAAGTLAPFAQRARRPAHGPARRSAQPLLTRALGHLLDTGRAGAIPSEILGNGVRVDPADAMALSEFLSGADSVRALTTRLHANATRLGWPAAERERLRQRAEHVVDDLVPTLTFLGLLQ